MNLLKSILTSLGRTDDVAPATLTISYDKKKDAITLALQHHGHTATDQLPLLHLAMGEGRMTPEETIANAINRLTNKVQPVS